MRHLVVLLLLIVALLPVPLSAGSTTLEYEYVSGATLHIPLLGVNQALCDDPDERCVGGAVFPMEGFNALATPSDDLWAAGAAVFLCIWIPGTESCTSGAASAGPGCGPQLVAQVPYVAKRGAVHVYSAYVASDLTICGATQGDLKLTLY